MSLRQSFNKHFPLEMRPFLHQDNTDIVLPKVLVIQFIMAMKQYSTYEKWKNQHQF